MRRPAQDHNTSQRNGSSVVLQNRGGRNRHAVVRPTLAGCLAVLLVTPGCGQESQQSSPEYAASLDTSDPTATRLASKVRPVTASVNNPIASDLPADGVVIGAADDDGDSKSIDGLLKQIERLDSEPLPEDADEALKIRRGHNVEIVGLAGRVLRQTIGDASCQKQFDQAIAYLLEARFQLALSGSDKDIDQLYADVQALNDRDPQSQAASEGIYYLAKFAHTKARLLGGSDPVWFENFSRWAREFARRFPDQQSRALALLFGAGRSCEFYAMEAELSDSVATRLLTEAKLCYVVLSEQFASTSQGQEATAVLRRLALPGNKLKQFAGPTIDGDYVSADEFVGQPTIIYFWDTENAEFQSELLPCLRKMAANANDRMRLIGVCLNEDVAGVREFIKREHVPGSQIFFPDESQRSWNCPLVRYWGISKCPAVWMVSADGVVNGINLSVDDIESASSATVN